MRLHKAFAVRGNHDEMLLTGRCDGMPDAVRFGIEYADRVIDPDHRRWLSTLPLVWGGFLDDSDPDARLSALLFHGSPWSPLDDYLYADSEKLSGLARFRYDLLAFGQTHRPLLKKANDVLLLNPGSVGQSRHRPAVACGATLQIRTGGFEPTLLECPYDPAPVIRLAVENGAGDWIRKHLE
jgi:predicted phosphodiesterase